MTTYNFKLYKKRPQNSLTETLTNIAEIMILDQAIHRIA